MPPRSTAGPPTGCPPADRRNVHDWLLGWAWLGSAAAPAYRDGFTEARESAPLNSTGEPSDSGQRQPDHGSWQGITERWYDGAVMVIRPPDLMAPDRRRPAVRTRL